MLSTLPELPNRMSACYDPTNHRLRDSVLRAITHMVDPRDHPECVDKCPLAPLARTQDPA